MTKAATRWNRTTRQGRRLRGMIAKFVCFVFAITVLDGCVSQRCYENADCVSPKLCNTVGECKYECLIPSDCAAGFTCVNHRCQPQSAGPITCPIDMAVVADTFCIDKYEASRTDATASSAGTNESASKSVAGVLPWQVANNSTAQTACQAAGKRLCTKDEWQLACSGPDRTAYAYGISYEPATCNGIDTYGLSSFHLMPTGVFPKCTNEWGAFDLNGNLWEHIAGGNDQTVRGGAYNCGDSATLHRCDYTPGTWTPSARGFRCCLTPAGAKPDDVGGVDAAILTDGKKSPGDAIASGGCVGGDGNSPDYGAAKDAAKTQDGSKPVDAPASGPSGCPAEMAPIDNYCIDRYEASRVDATNFLSGSSTIASTRAGVIPWFPVTLAEAQAGCASMGKRLCKTDEWFSACRGAASSAYSYGNIYAPITCNGIDSFCDCAASTCAGLATCPYPHCFNQASSSGSGGPCGANFHVVPTGSFSACTNSYGVFDINGNVWEIVDTTDGLEHFRGGAYNCGDSELLHRCDYDATWNPLAKGFRCCKDRS